MHKIPLLLSVLLTLASCTKEEHYPQVYNKTNFLQGDLVSIDKGLQMTDTAQINGFLRKVTEAFAPLNFYPTLDSNMLIYEQMVESFQLLSESRAQFMLNDNKVMQYKVEKKGTVYYFMADTLVKIPENPANKYFRYSPDIIKTEKFEAGTLYSYYPTLYAYDMGNSIVFPVLSFVAEAERGYLYFGKQNNSLSPAYISQFSATPATHQTLVYRESRIVFSRQ